MRWKGSRQLSAQQSGKPCFRARASSADPPAAINLSLSAASMERNQRMLLGCNNRLFRECSLQLGVDKLNPLRYTVEYHDGGGR